MQPHMRSAPDGDRSNNWPTQGNQNPYTRAVGHAVTGQLLKLQFWLYGMQPSPYNSDPSPLQRRR